MAILMTWSAGAGDVEHFEKVEMKTVVKPPSLMRNAERKIIHKKI